MSTIKQEKDMSIRSLIQEQFRHFNAAVVKDASQAWVDHLDAGGKMFFTMAGAMSTAELGISLAEMIRQDKIHAICTTGANLEEDVFNLVAHDFYERVPGYRHLTAEEEQALHDRGMNRVTDTCIPEDEAMRRIEKRIVPLWQAAEAAGKSYYPYEFLFQLFENHSMDEDFQIDPKNSWLYAAWQKKLPIFTPGWEDATLANFFVAAVMKKQLKGFTAVRHGLEQMERLANWYLSESVKQSIGFFQIGGGIAGDFPICVVPMIHQDLKKECPLWGYFCQISDSTTSYGSYSGAVPNEKITWGKLSAETPKFIIESDASIVAPLVFGYVLNR